MYSEALTSKMKKFYEDNALLFMLVCAVDGEETFKNLIEEGANKWFNDTADKIGEFKDTFKVV